MKNQKATQAVVTTQEKLNPNQGSMLLSLFNEDGTPLVPGAGGSNVVIPGDNMATLAGSLMFNNPNGNTNWLASEGMLDNGFFGKNEYDEYVFNKSGLFSAYPFFQTNNMSQVPDKTSFRLEFGAGGYGFSFYKDVSEYSVGDSIPMGSMDYVDSMVFSAAAGQNIRMTTPAPNRITGDEVSVMFLFYPLLLIES